MVKKVFQIDTSKFDSAIKKTLKAVEPELNDLMTDIKDNWLKTSRDIAPIDTGLLRREIDGNVTSSHTEFVVKMNSKAMKDKFNYAYYIHERNAGGKSLKQGRKKYLTESVDSQMPTWNKWANSTLESIKKRGGW